MRSAHGVVAVLSTAQERFERTRVGEVAISALVSVTVIVALVWSSPDSAIRRAAVPPLEPVAVGSGLDQAWYMFAPDPFRRLETVKVRVVTSDGDVRLWTFPHGNVINQFSWYHWHKVKESLVKDPAIRADFAHWAARRLVGPAEYPAHVAIVLTTVSFPPPGVKSPEASRSSQTLYAETLTGQP